MDDVKWCTNRMVYWRASIANDGVPSRFRPSLSKTSCRQNYPLTWPTYMYNAYLIPRANLYKLPSLWNDNIIDLWLPRFISILYFMPKYWSFKITVDGATWIVTINEIDRICIIKTNDVIWLKLFKRYLMHNQNGMIEILNDTHLRDFVY